MWSGGCTCATWDLLDFAVSCLSAGAVQYVEFSASGDMIASVHVGQKFAMLWKCPQQAAKTSPFTDTIQRRVV